jgi:hypothetical protein
MLYLINIPSGVIPKPGAVLPDEGSCAGRQGLVVAPVPGVGARATARQILRGTPLWMTPDWLKC